MKNNSLANVSLRLSPTILFNILDPIVEQLLPEEYKSGTVKVYKTCWESDTRVLVDSVGVVQCERGRSHSLYIADEWSDKWADGNLHCEISVSEFWVQNWTEGSMKNQSFLFMKSHLIRTRFESAIREYLKNR